MTRVHCNRVWEAEARLDGRLGEKDEASYARHIRECADCAAQEKKLRELAETLSALPYAPRTELDRRRARSALLRQANAQVVEAPRAKTRFALGMIPVLALAAALVFFLRGRAPHAAPSVVLPQFEVANVHDAQLREEVVGNTSRVVLSSGTASFHVEHLHSTARFVVALPDGEVEVRGTRFVVEVIEGKTRSVTVTEGVVAVRLAGYEGVLRAGERWPSSTAAALAPPLAVPSGAASDGLRPTPETLPSAPPPSVSSPLAAGNPAVSAPRPSTTGSAPDRSSPGPRFAESMRAYEAGDYGRADALFGAFAREFPNDSRTEDALFLKADARARRGDREGASRAASEYLKRYPQGFRSPEAKRLVLP